MMKHTVMDYVPAAAAPTAHQAAGTFGNPHIVSNWNMHVSAAQVQAFVAARAEVAS